MKDQEKVWDRRLQIQTAGRDDSGADQYHHPYEPTPYSVLERLANSGLIGAGDAVIDYGCGKGRVDFFLSYQTKAGTIGIEYDERIYKSAQENQKNTVTRTKTEFVLMRAEEYNVPIVTYRDDEIVATEPENKYTKIEAHLTHMNVRGVESMEAELDFAPDKFLYVDEPERLEELIPIMFFCRNQSDTQTDHSMMMVNLDTVNKKNYLQSVEKLVQKAVYEDGFYVVYQPIINTATGKCESAEALVRLKDTKTLGFISPEVFIPIAEKQGLIGKLGDQVFYKVCRYIRDSHLKERGIKSIEVNLSGLQISDPDIPYTLHQKVKSFGIDPSMINLEITETALVQSGKVVLDNMEKLKGFGYKFSMDDFGTGYSNFHQIASIKYDLIKIDKSLIWPAFEEGNIQAQTILFGCIKMMHTLGLSIVAEGVETASQAEELRAHGVEFLQGYYYSKPIPEDEFLQFVERHNQTVDELYVSLLDVTTNFNTVSAD